MNLTHRIAALVHWRGPRKPPPPLPADFRRWLDLPIDALLP